ncbi:MAG: carboxymuconolactone decarboxylase family protein [Clostridiaceae bacterium]
MADSRGKKLYSITETYRIIVYAMRSIPDLKRAKRSGEMTTPFMERVMLAVTEVNGCALCSYYHTRVSLENGMNAEEIKGMLGGEFAGAPEAELPAILFAQHYADTRGNPSKQAWERVLAVYGETGAYGVLASIRMIMMGNAFGIVWGSFFNRFRGKADPRSSLLYEIAQMLCTVPFVLAGMIHAGILRLIKKPVLAF